LRFLVDENLPFEIIEYLQSINHDVFDVAASDIRGSLDKVLWSKAAEEKRIIITETLIILYQDSNQRLLES
jgi:predicted nuclease of predicted toxin-antitoxin system